MLISFSKLLLSELRVISPIRPYSYSLASLCAQKQQWPPETDINMCTNMEHDVIAACG